MIVSEETEGQYNQADYQAAFIFDPDEGDEARQQQQQQQQPAKRRKVGKQQKKASGEAARSDEALRTSFVPLLNGAEKLEYVRLRERLYEETWTKIDARIQTALRESNSATLQQVTSFVEEAQTDTNDKIPSAFIITGTNIASQDMLFEQLSESLQKSSRGKFVRLRSSEATSLKTTLKKIIRDATDNAADDDDDNVQFTNGHDVRRHYLNYDLEALHAFIKPHNFQHVVVALEDSEGFDSGLLSDLITLLNSWRPRIPFTLIFGIATSVELLQARLLKSACHQIDGAQFDAVQTSSILETVFNIAVAADDVPVRVGASVLRGMLDRQQDQVAGIQAFINSLKYAYMCHFYANALSPLMHTEEHGLERCQPEHLDAIRSTVSHRAQMERELELLEASGSEVPDVVFDQLESYIHTEAQPGMVHRRQWVSCTLRTLLVLKLAAVLSGVGFDFMSTYVDAMAGGIVVSEYSTLTQRIRRMDSATLLEFMSRAMEIYSTGDEGLHLGPSIEPEHGKLQETLQKLAEDLRSLQRQADEKGIILKTKSGVQNKVIRTTVVAQRVQLSKNSAALSEEDKALTRIVDEMTKLLVANLSVPSPHEVPFAEVWMYDSRSPSKDVFVPRPRVVFERGLTRPHDYLNCGCCNSKDGEDGGGGIRATLPATSVLYQLYLETGNLINVADLWSAFQAIVGKDEEDERQTVALFYEALAELRFLGFAKASKKKTDHIAKLKWL